VNSGVFFFVDPSSSEAIVVKPMQALDIERTRIADTLFQAADLQIAPITTILDSQNDAIVRSKLQEVAESLVPKITEKQFKRLPEQEKAHIQKLRSNRDNLRNLVKNHSIQFFTMKKLDAKPIFECTIPQIDQLLGSQDFWKSMAIGFMVDVVTGNHDRFISFNPGNIMIGVDNTVFFIDNNLDISSPDAHVADLPRIKDQIPAQIRTFCDNLHQCAFNRNSADMPAAEMTNRLLAEIPAAAVQVRIAVSEIKNVHPLFSQITQSDILGSGETK